MPIIIQDGNVKLAPLYLDSLMHLWKRKSKEWARVFDPFEMRFLLALENTIDWSAAFECRSRIRNFLASELTH